MTGVSPGLSKAANSKIVRPGIGQGASRKKSRKAAKMKIKEVTNYIEQLAPLSTAEDFDNVGLLVGNNQTEVSGILVTLDTLEEVVDEAIENNCNLIVSFHPIIFSGLKKINGNSYVERVVIKAIQNNIAIYCMHTALDNVFEGVSGEICDRLGLLNKKILIPKTGNIQKLSTFVPKNDAEKLRAGLFEAGAGHIGNYSNCSFNIEGTGTFMGNEDSNPSHGKKGEEHHEKETMVGVVFEKHKEHSVISALKSNHPYEEVAYEVISLENKHPYMGMGMIGELDKQMNASDFMNKVKETFQTPCIRHSKIIDKAIKKVAVLGGSGSFAIEAAKKAGADAYISADFKYHDFYKAENELILMDIGHFESEQFTKNLIFTYLRKKITKFEVVLSNTRTNPIYYL